MSCETCPSKPTNGDNMNLNPVCTEHSGIVTWLRGIGATASLLLIFMVVVSTATYRALNDYKLSHSDTTSEMNSSINNIAGSVEILDITVSNQLVSIKDDMVDVKTSNQNTMVAVQGLIRALENKGLLTKQHKDSTILLVRDFEAKY